MNKEYFYKEDWKSAKKKFKRVCEHLPITIIKSNGTEIPIIPKQENASNN